MWIVRKELISSLCRSQFAVPLEIKRFRHSHGILGQPVTISLLAIPRHMFKQGCKCNSSVSWKWKNTSVFGISMTNVEKLFRKDAEKDNNSGKYHNCGWRIKQKLLGKFSQYNFKKEMCRDQLGQCSPICSRIAHTIKELYLSKDTARLKSWKQNVDELWANRRWMSSG